jgi:hypothetical protein
VTCNIQGNESHTSSPVICSSSSSGMITPCELAVLSIGSGASSSMLLLNLLSSSSDPSPDSSSLSSSFSLTFELSNAAAVAVAETEVVEEGVVEEEPIPLKENVVPVGLLVKAKGVVEGLELKVKGFGLVVELDISPKDLNPVVPDALPNEKGFMVPSAGLSQLEGFAVTDAKPFAPSPKAGLSVSFLSVSTLTLFTEVSSL